MSHLLNFVFVSLLQKEPEVKFFTKISKSSTQVSGKFPFEIYIIFTEFAEKLYIHYPFSNEEN